MNINDIPSCLHDCYETEAGMPRFMTRFDVVRHSLTSEWAESAAKTCRKSVKQWAAQLENEIEAKKQQPLTAPNAMRSAVVQNYLNNNKLAQALFVTQAALASIDEHVTMDASDELKKAAKVASYRPEQKRFVDAFRKKNQIGQRPEFV